MVQDVRYNLWINGTGDQGYELERANGELEEGEVYFDPMLPHMGFVQEGYQVLLLQRLQ